MVTSYQGGFGPCRVWVLQKQPWTEKEQRDSLGGYHNQLSQEGRCGFPAMFFEFLVSGGLRTTAGEEWDRRWAGLPGQREKEAALFKPHLLELQGRFIWGIGKVEFY